MKELIRKILGQRIINYYHLAQAILANFIYGFPSKRLHVIGVTGTDGKTTTVNMIAVVLKEAEMKVSFLSTINAEIGEEKFDTGLHTTTPSPFLLQKLLRKMVKAGSKYAVLEVTSHALDQFRTWGIKFETAVLTNITHEHLDYHKTYEEYAEAKARLFRNVKNAVLNADDQSLGYLTPALSDLPRRRAGIGEGERVRLLTYGFSNADIWADHIEETLTHTKSIAHALSEEHGILLNLPGKFNVSNALAAIAVGQVYDMTLESISSALGKVKSIPGRLELFVEGQEFQAMVDFAHTPNALEKLLSFLRPLVWGKIIAVFGAAGERDQSKRPKMGAVADKYADMIVITREDNRSEDVMEISQEIAEGIRRKHLDKDYYIIPDRREALRFALSKAQKGDMVVICGKGHERSLNIDGKEIEWSDREEMKRLLRELA